MNEDLIAALRAAVAAAPDIVGVRLQLGETLLAAGEPEEALFHARAVLVAAPDDGAALGLAARAGRAAGQDDVAAGFARLLEATSGGKPAGPARRARVGDGSPAERADPDGSDESGLFDEELERPRVTLADVGGLVEVKQRLEAAFLAPMRNPELRRYYGKSLRGGLLLFGPPGCGKTFLARAVAGELGAGFFAIGLNDVLDSRPHGGSSAAPRSGRCSAR